jgi:hypothetical protein
MKQPRVKVPGIIIRLAKNDDLEIKKIAKLETAVWGENGAGADKISARLNIFPAGSYIAENKNNGEIVGYVCFQQVGDLREQNNLTWFDITDEGLTTKSHRPNGEYLYGISLSVHYSMNGKKLAPALIAQAFLFMFSFNKKGYFVGSRIPMFKRYRNHYPQTTAADYVKIRRRNGNLYDYELHMYHAIGLNPVVAKVLPDFFPDPDSENYGALLFDENTLYGQGEDKVNRAIKLLADQNFSSLKKMK